MLKTQHASPALTLAAAFLAAPLVLALSDYSPWQAAVAVDVGSVIDPLSADVHVTLSKDGRRLYFTSNRREPESVGGFDIWVSRWDDEAMGWGKPTIVPNVNSPMGEFTPALSRDGHWLFFCSNRPGSMGRKDLYASYRAHTHDDTSWGLPVHLGPAVNSVFDEFGVTYFENDGGHPQLFFGSSRAGGTEYDIYMSEMGLDGTFGTPTSLTEINTAAWELQPTIRRDGRELLFVAPGAFGQFDIWVSTRASTLEPWGKPLLLGPEVNTARTEASPALSGDGSTLVFSRESGPGAGDGSIWMSQRQKPR